MPVVLDDDTGERVLLYGADGATLRKVAVNASGQLVAGLAAGSELLADIQGWDGAAWQKLLADAAKHIYVNQYGVPGVERKSTTNAAVGVNNIPFSAVPAGRIWQIDMLIAYNNTSAITSVAAALVVGATYHNLGTFGATAVGVSQLFKVAIWAKAGDYPLIGLGGCTAGDDIYCDLFYREFYA